MRRYIVRQVQLLTRGCFPMDESEVGDPNLVCPLCAIERGDDRERSAAFTRLGYISCSRCGRLSAIYLTDGTPVVPVPNGQRTSTLVESLTLMSEIRPALDGQGHLLEMVARDEEQPMQNVPFAVPPLVLTHPEEDDDRQAPPASPLERLRRVRGGFPPCIERVLVTS